MKKLKKCLLLIAMLILISALYLHLSHKKTVATLVITGNSSQEEIEWKNPSFPLEKAILPTHEIFFSFAQGEVHAFFWGDLIGIRYKALEFHPFFHLLGWKDFIEFEALCSDYINLEKKERFPSKVIKLKKTSSIYRPIWEKLFSDTSGNFFIRRATLGIEYFPLTDAYKAFQLSCENGSLVAN